MRYLATIATVFMAFGYWAQVGLSVFDCSINSPEVTQAEIDGDDNFYKQCILFTANDNYLFDQDDNKDVTAKTEIRIKKGFHAGQFSSIGEMHLKMEEEQNLDVFSMNQANLGAIPQFDKLELGIDLPNNIDQQIDNFFNNVATNALSPFDPKDIIVEADFFYFYEPNGTWLPNPVKIFGFYYEEFSDIGTDWQNENTQYDFRIRYTPRVLGKWKCSIKVLIDQVETFKANDFFLEVVPSDLKDFTRVGVNKRYFKIGDEPFFPVGQNLPWAGRGEHYNPQTEDIEEYHVYLDDIRDLSDAGANYFRFLMNPWSHGIEFEELGHYEDRMSNAWEIDRILAVAKEEDLRIHFNLQVHYPFERVAVNSAVHWDWSAANVPTPAGVLPAYSANCNYWDDYGYCYSTELDLPTPKDFLQSQEALEFYKMRIRYIISRWGYSTEISVLELFSEANNIGEHANLVYNGSNCPSVEPNTTSPYLTDVAYPQLVYYWQNEICRYIKQDLHHIQHPLGVNYTGHPNFDNPTTNTSSGCNISRGDYSYYSPYTDFWTWNSYSYTPERFEYHVNLNNQVNPNNNVNVVNTPTNINKPLMYSEIGLAGVNCDFDLTWRQMIAISPFDGSSGGLCYDRNNNFTTAANIVERNSLWKTYGYVNEFIEGVKLDEDNWQFGHDDRADNEADVTYLRRPNSPRAAMGAIQNKTVNFYTGRDLGAGNLSPCYTSGQDPSFKDSYKQAKSVTPGNGKNRLRIENMGSKKDYWIKWYNPFNGYYYPTTSATTNNAGRLTLDFPQLSGNGISSVLLFKAYRVGQPSFQPEIPVTVVNDDYLLKDFLVQEYEKPDIETRLPIGIFPNNITREVLVVPNPNNGRFRVLFEGDAKMLEITNSMGKPILFLNNPQSGEELDLSNFSSGVYFVNLRGGETSLRTKFVIK